MHYVVKLKINGKTKYLKNFRADKFTASKADAQRVYHLGAAQEYAQALRKYGAKVYEVDEKPLYEGGSKYHLINPAPSPASRSAKFARLRAKFLTQLQIAKRKGSFVLEQSIGQKLRKLDRIFYAPRGKHKGLYRSNPPKRIPWHVIAIYHPMGKVYAGNLKRSPDGSVSLSFVDSKEMARLYQSAGSAVADAKDIQRGLRYRTEVEPFLLLPKRKR